MEDISTIPLGPNDVGAGTIGEYLGYLLLKLWEEEEGFSGKRPFGNSGWQGVVYDALVRAKLVSGTFDEYGYAEEVDTQAADEMICGYIRTLFHI